MSVNAPAEQGRSGLRQLHLGCGRNILPKWINLDISPLPGVDVVADLDDCAKTPLPFDDNSIDKFLGVHVLEHIRDYLSLMQELHRIAKPGAEAIFLVPYGSSDDALEDPTHVRQFFINSFVYFAQPYYWRADYGYRGDWQPEYITLRVKRATYEGKTKEEVFQDVRHLRNVVEEMMVSLKAIKPIRPPKKELQALPKLDCELV
jgi:SAM-dependent methyltransferase